MQQCPTELHKMSLALPPDPLTLGELMSYDIPPNLIPFTLLPNRIHKICVPRTSRPVWRALFLCRCQLAVLIYGSASVLYIGVDEVAQITHFGRYQLHVITLLYSSGLTQSHWSYITVG